MGFVAMQVSKPKTTSSFIFLLSCLVNTYRLLSSLLFIKLHLIRKKERWCLQNQYQSLLQARSFEENLKSCQAQAVDFDIIFVPSLEGNLIHVIMPIVKWQNLCGFKLIRLSSIFMLHVIIFTISAVKWNILRFCKNWKKTHTTFLPLYYHCIMMR